MNNLHLSLLCLFSMEKAQEILRSALEIYQGCNHLHCGLLFQWNQQQPSRQKSHEILCIQFDVGSKSLCFTIGKINSEENFWGVNFPCDMMNTSDKRVSFSLCDLNHHLNPTLTGINLIQLGSRVLCWQENPAATIDEGVPNHQNQQSCQKEHAAFSSGVEHVFLPTSKEDIMSCANGFQRLIFNWFILQHADCLNYLKLES